MIDTSSQSFKIAVATALVLSTCVVDSVSIAYDGSVMGSINIMKSYQEYFSINTATKAVNTTAVHLGAIMIAPFSGWIVDKGGRRWGILIAAILNLIGAVISAAAHNTATFIAGRIVLGLGMGLAQVSAGSYVSETTAPQVRAFALGMYFSCWAIGGFIATGVSYGSVRLEPSNWAWRVPSLIQGFAPICLIILFPFLPESPRWLINNDRLDEGLQVLARINGTHIDDPVVQVQYREIIDTLEYEKREVRSVPIREIFRNAPNRKRLALAVSIAPLTMLTGSNVITYYYGDMLSQAGITSSRTQMAINLVLSAWQFIVAVSGSAMAEKIGRRILCLGSLGGCTIMFYVVGALTSAYGNGSNQSGVYGTVASIFLFLGFYSFGLTPLTQMYPPEVLSYNLRGTGMALFTLSAKASAIFVTMVFPYMFEAIGWKTYIVNASWNLLFWVWVFFYWVETKGKTLEEIDVLFDGVKHSDAPDLKEIQNGAGEKSMIATVEEI